MDDMLISHLDWFLSDNFININKTEVIVDDISHEEISLLMMKKMNEEMNGRLDLAIEIFKDELIWYFTEFEEMLY